MDSGTGNLWAFNAGVWWHFILRAVVVYGLVLVLLRFSGKRQVGQMTPFDLVLLLLISNAVQNAMNGGDNSITAGVILAASLIAADVFLGWITRRSRKVETLVEGNVEILVHNGHVRVGALKKAGLTQHDLLEALRLQGCANVTDVRAAILETSGRISVLTRRENNEPK